MKSPFPGMDPYLEAHWGDVHTRLATYASDQLAPQLPGELVIRIQEYVKVEADSGWDGRRIGPDVGIVEQPIGSSPIAATAVAETTEIDADPLIVPLPLEEPVLHEIQIIDRQAGNRVITVIEFLSLANRRSGRAAYLQKQKELLDGGVNLVEIDLLRSGPWIIAVPPDAVKETHRGPYRICVIRSGVRHQAEIYRASYRFPLPEIAVPLRKEDADVQLALQPLIEQVYRNGQYDRTDYRADPVPPLPLDEQQWADEWLRQAGRR
jgi:hypothetical protein